MSSKVDVFFKKLFDEVYFHSIKKMLCEKNRMYGNSIFNPVQIYSSLGAKEQIEVRIDDKISRLKNQQEDDSEDTIKDLIGYFILRYVLDMIGEENIDSATRVEIIEAINIVMPENVFCFSSHFIKEAIFWDKKTMKFKLDR